MSTEDEFRRTKLKSSITRDAFIGFVDLLGIREMARSHPEDYKQTIFKFQQEIVDLEPEKKGGEVYGFSDSLYCAFPTFEDLADYLAELRGRLISHQPDPIFFRAAITRGQLSASTPKHGAHVFGFGEDASRIFGLEEECKGIGIRIDPDLKVVEKDPKHSRIFRNFYLAQGTGSPPTFFSDLKLLEKDLTDAIFDEVIRAFYRSKVRSKKFGRYYLSLVANFIECIQFQKIHISRNSDSSAVRWTPANVVDFFTSGKWDRLFGDVIGGDAIYFLLYSKIHDATAGNLRGAASDLCESLKRHILAQKRLKRELATVPEKLLSARAKNALVRDIEHLAFASKGSSK